MKSIERVLKNTIYLLLPGISELQSKFASEADLLMALDGESGIDLRVYVPGKSAIRYRIFSAEEILDNSFKESFNSRVMAAFGGEEAARRAGLIEVDEIG